MINSAVFDPVERVYALISNWAKGKASFMRVFSKTAGFAFEKTLPSDLFGKDIDFKLTTATRDLLLASAEFDLGYEFLDSSQNVIKTGTIHVKNCLVTDAPLPSWSLIDGKKVTNGFVSSGKVCYPEALTTIAENPHIESQSKFMSSVRSFYQYVLAAPIQSGNVDIQVLGPAPDTNSQLSTAKVVIGSRTFSVNAIIPETSSEPVYVNEDVLTDATRPTAIAFRTPDGQLYPFVFGQRSFIIDGKTLSFDIVLFALKVALLFEKFDQAGAVCAEHGIIVNDQSQIVIPLAYDQESFYIEDALLSFERKFLNSNSLLAPYFERLQSTGDALIINTSKGTGYLARRSHAASCYLFAVATMLALSDKGSLSCQLDYLLALADSDFMKIVVEDRDRGSFRGVFNGNDTARFTRNSPLHLFFPTRKGATATLYRVTTTDGVKEDGFFVLQVASGEKEHYVVCKHENGVDYLIYDSDRFNPIPFNERIDSTGKVAIGFVGEINSLSGSMAYSEGGASTIG